MNIIFLARAQMLRSVQSQKRKHKKQVLQQQNIKKQSELL